MIRVDKKSFRLMVWPNSFLYGKRKMLIKFLINLVGLDLAYGTEIKEMESDEFRMSLED